MMPSLSKVLFDRHIGECHESIALYEHFEKMSFRADSNLRFVWIAAVSAFDHYISSLILELATRLYSNGGQLTPKLLSENFSFSHVIELKSANSVEAVIVFRRMLGECIRYKSYQSPDKVADGLSYIWNERHKWQFLSNSMGMTTENARGTLDAIVERRNLIAHNADYDDATGAKLPIDKNQTSITVDFLSKLVSTIDTAVI